MSAWFRSPRLLPHGAGWLRLIALLVVGAAVVAMVYFSRDAATSAVAVADLAAAQNRGDAIENRAEGYYPRKVLARALPPITDVPLMSAAEADKILNPAELVLGVVVEGQARAYPVNMLTGPRREIINDRLGGRAIAATW
jgi:hypothetical protein